MLLEVFKRESTFPSQYRDSLQRLNKCNLWQKSSFFPSLYSTRRFLTYSSYTQTRFIFKKHAQVRRHASRNVTKLVFGFIFFFTKNLIPRIVSISCNIKKCFFRGTKAQLEIPNPRPGAVITRYSPTASN